MPELWPYDQRSERLAYFLLAIALMVVGAWKIHPLFGCITAILWGLWFVWLLVVQPAFFPPKPELSPEEVEAAGREAWAERMSGVDPTTFAMSQRDLLAAQRKNEELERRVLALELRKQG